MINTENSENCDVKKTRKKKDTPVEEPIFIEIGTMEGETKEEEIAKESNFGVVTLVTDRYVVIEFDGRSIHKVGRYNCKIGDKFEV